jgi:MoaA/NifB/PqqE/SkfB family radical SAM enzyme
MNCKFCSEQSTTNGRHGDLTNHVVETFPPYTEVAIGGGNPLSHPQLEEFLTKLKSQKCFPSITINQKHFMQEFERIKTLAQNEMIYGIGISIYDINEELASKINELPNAVCHVIAGIVTLEQLKKMSELGIKKVLFLGYKIFGRGAYYYSGEVQAKINELKENMKNVKEMFKVISFDNLAIEQLNVKDIVPKEKWEEFYMGDDGSFTMYVDLVEKKYAQSSISNDRFDLLPTINDMFLDIRKRKEKTNEN